jgi:hypothetical protein
MPDALAGIAPSRRPDTGNSANAPINAYFAGNGQALSRLYGNSEAKSH